MMTVQIYINQIFQGGKNMNQGKWIFGVLSALPLVGMISVTMPSIGNGQTEERSADDILLEQRIEALSDKNVLKVETMAKPFSLSESIAKLRAFKQTADAKTPSCVDARKTIFSNKYVMTFDAQGKPCRIYDLSFPNLQALFTRKKATQVPVRTMTSKDYLNWLDGNMDGITQTNDQYKRNFNVRFAARNSWISKLKFRNKPVAVPGSKLSLLDVGLPQSFSLADLDIGNQFRFDARTLGEVQGLMNELKKTEVMSGISESEGIASEYLIKVMNKPETLLQGVRFNWNDLDKVYDVVLEGDFLPIKGPVALVDYQTQYKYAVEKMFRSFLSSGLEQLSRFIPNKIISSVVEVLISDSFEQIELMYDYQMLQLEDSLKTIAMDSRSGLAEEITPNYALNVLYGQRSDLFSSYILAVAQSKEFDWFAFDKLGKTARYNVEKQRDVMMGKMNSRLVLEKKCEVEFFQEYFAICSKAGQKNAVYSLISEQSIVVKNFGAPMIYRYARPYETSLVRGGTWVLSVALRIIGLPLSRTITYQLDGILKKSMRAGLLDEALLKNNLTTKKQSGVLSADHASMLNWLFIQNLNPFLPKTLASENNLVAINKQLLGISELQ
jgi:hypothetical protein